MGTTECDHAPIERHMLDVALGDDEQDPSSSSRAYDEKGLTGSCAERDGLLNCAEPTARALDEEAFTAGKPRVRSPKGQVSHISDVVSHSTICFPSIPASWCPSSEQ